jgi:hypothetical protein
MPLAQKTEKALNEAIDKGIKPYFTSASTGAMRKAYYNDAKRAFGVILRLKPELMNEDGVLERRLPRTRAEFQEAITQAKREVYKLYHGQSVAAGQAGAGVNVAPVMNDLYKVSQDIGFSPEIRAYAAKLRLEMTELMAKGPDVVEKRIQEMNEGLQAFFKNPTKDGATKARIEASVVARLREQADRSITETIPTPQATLPGMKPELQSGYMKLRSDYKALKTIERDIGRQVAVEMRKNPKGLLDMTDIFTGSDILMSLAMHDPSALVHGVAGRGIKEYIKWLNDPNRYIAKGFELLEKMSEEKGSRAVQKIVPGMNPLEGAGGPPGAAFREGELGPKASRPRPRR